MKSLFDPFKLGDIELRNRVVMAPMTRSRASSEGVHGDLAAAYYGQRSGAGLIISEATAVSKQGSGYPNIPGIWNDAQAAGWQGVTKAVHAKDGKIFLQMFHTGRIGHSSLYSAQPVSSSDIPPEGQIMAADHSMQDYEKPRALKTEEVPAIVAQYKTGAANAKKAGFDGIEIHSANGYILDQFLRDGVNKRGDQYGGGIENRARLLLDVVKACIQIWGPHKVGVRISPYNPFNSMSDSNPMKTFTHVAEALNEYPLAYLHIMEPVGEGAFPGQPRIADEIRKIYKGVLMINGGMTKDIAERMLNENKADLVAFGAAFISNPDLAERLRKNIPLEPADQSTFYVGGAKGYIDYPAADNAA